MANPQHNVELYSLAQVSLKTATAPQISIRNLVPSDGDVFAHMSKHMLWIQDVERPTDKKSAEAAIEKIRDFNTTIVVLDDEAIVSSPTSLILLAASNRGSTAGSAFQVFGAFEFYYIQDHVTDYEPTRVAKVYFARDPDSEHLSSLHHTVLGMILDFAFEKASKGGLQLDRSIFTLTKSDMGFLHELAQAKTLLARFERVKWPEAAREGGTEWYSFDVERSDWEEAKARITLKARHT